jgi:thiol:disulfide interchange protein
MKKSGFFNVLLCLIFAVGAIMLDSAAMARPKIAWHKDIRDAFKLAKQQGKPLMVEFMAEWCPSCKMMEDSTFVNPEVVEKTDRFVPVRIDVDRQKDVATEYKASAMKYGGIGIPNILFMTRDGRKLKHRIGYMDAGTLTAVMDSVLTESK